MKRAVRSKCVVAMLVATAALATGAVASAGHPAPSPTDAKALYLCPPVC